MLLGAVWCFPSGSCCVNKKEIIITKWKIWDNRSIKSEHLFLSASSSDNSVGCFKVFHVKYSFSSDCTFKICASRSLWLNNLVCVKISQHTGTPLGVFCIVPVTYSEMHLLKAIWSWCQWSSFLNPMGKLTECLFFTDRQEKEGRLQQLLKFLLSCSRF